LGFWTFWKGIHIYAMLYYILQNLTQQKFTQQ
jgi:predicted membrane-bound dolichyl-phosphate-mannose-protein mannosyltransferase